MTTTTLLPFLARLLAIIPSTSATKHPLLLRLLRAGAASTAAIALVLIVETWHQRRSHWSLPVNPVVGRSIWGHLITMMTTQGERHDWAFWISRFHLDQGKGFTSFVHVPFTPVFVLSSDPRTVEWVLKSNFDNYVKGPFFYSAQMPLLGHGIFNSDGDEWKKQRKTASYIFNVANFRDHMVQVFADHTHDLCAVLDEAAASGRSTEGVVDLYDLLHRFTLDAFMEIGFGTSLHSLRQREPLPFAVAFDTAQSITSRRMVMSPAQRAVVEFLNGDARKLARCAAVADQFATKVITERRGEIAGDDQTVYADLLSRFLVMKKPDGSGYSDRELRDVVMNFIIAGRDTTAQALSWTVYMLHSHPEVVAKLRAELAEQFPGIGPDQSLWGDSSESDSSSSSAADAYAALSRNLVYARAVFSEALRLYPSVPTEIKFAVNDDTLPDGSAVRAGDAVIWSPYAMARITEIWGADAAEFKPERWIDQATGKFVQPSPFKFPVFNAGPRVCLGQQMAYLEGVACLATLVHRYELTVVNADQVKYRNALTLQMMNGLKVRPTRRRAGAGAMRPHEE
ncbi:cytochrome P450 [Blastocladiella britannica]|nr:cytochrome P450 [Blastocladiella britannica]